MSCVPSSEWPPRRKKLSSTLTPSTASSADRIAASSVSTSVRGATSSPSRSVFDASGAGSAARSTLPFVVSGSDDRTTNVAGTM